MPMKKNILFLLFFLLNSMVVLEAQTSNESNKLPIETISDEAQFTQYQDTIDKYIYRDAEVAAAAIQACEAILQKNTKIPNEELLKYAVNRIYYELNNYDLLACYQIIKDNEHILTDETVSDRQKGNFIYIRGYTQMSLGDLAAAQKTYYQMLEKGRLLKDTALLINGLHSLGQLLGGEKEYESAIKHFLEIKDLLKVNKSRPSTRALTDYELAEAYLQSGQLDKALKVVENGLLYLETQNMERLKPDFLITRGAIALQQNDLQAAKSYYQEIDELAQKNKDPYTLESSQLFYAELLVKQKKLQPALDIYNSLLENYDSTQLENQLTALGEAHIIAHQLGNQNNAYQYLLRQTEVTQKIKNQEKRQQTAYLKIQFESTQKEKENQELAIQILQNQNQSRFLYFMLASFFLVSLFLYFAFAQKKKYNQTLQKEVKKQTKELQRSNLLLGESNKELAQFNRILSHDLREPLRSIVGFSYLAQKEMGANTNISEYMRLIEKSGKQLYQIIQDVASYQDIDNHLSKPPTWMDPKPIAENIITSLEKGYQIATINISYFNLKSIYINPFILKILMENILENSIKFNQNKIPELSISYYMEKGNHCFKFKDNGIGIAPKFHQTVFDMFKRLNTRDNYEGSGLGLSTLRKLIEKMEGSIEVLESKPNQGSTFLVTFPIVEDLEKSMITNNKTSTVHA